MITRNADREISVREHAFGGTGRMYGRVIAAEQTMYGKNRLFNHVCLEPGDEVGWHVHSGDGEVYYILSGEGEYNDNGAVTTVYPGDVTWTSDGEGHSIKPAAGGRLEFIALVVYSK